MTRRLRCGQSIEIGKALATTFALGVFYLLFSEAWAPLKAEADVQVTNSTAQQGVDWIALSWEWYLALSLGIIVTGVIAAAAFQRQGGL